VSDEPDHKPAEQPAEAPRPAAAALPPERQGAAFRKRLLDRLPKLEVRGFAMADTMRGAAASVDLKSILDLEADAFIGPLEALAPENAR